MDPLLSHFVPVQSAPLARFARILDESRKKIYQQMAMPTFFDISVVSKPVEMKSLKKPRKVGKTLSGYADRGRRRRTM